MSRSALPGPNLSEYLDVHSLDHFEKVKSLYEYQVKNNPVLRSFVKTAGRPLKIERWEDITFLPVQAFKDHDVISGNWSVEKVFLSSGTSQQSRSRHLIPDLSWYHKRTEKCFTERFDKVQKFRHLVFMPFYRENPQSSLLEMMSHFLELSGHQGSNFVDSEDELDRLIRQGDESNTIVWTVTFGLLDYLRNSRLEKLQNLTFIETGGMKGRRKEESRMEIHQNVKKRWPRVRVYSEYGMCEMISQAYSEQETFTCPSGLLVVGNELDDPFRYRLEGRNLQLNFIDMANVHSCAFLATQDLGSVYGETMFSVEGRVQSADLRGCNLMYE